MSRWAARLFLLSFFLLGSCEPSSSPNASQNPDPFQNNVITSVPENAVDTNIVTAAATDQSAAISITGSDAGLFVLAQTGHIRFLQPPDFEHPGDSNHDNEYDITVTTTLRGQVTSVTYHIRVTDVRELPSGISDFNITTTGNSGQLFDFTLSSGQSYSVQGERDDTGAPAAIRSVLVSNIQNVAPELRGASLRAFTNANGRFEEMYLSTGAFVKFIYGSDGRISAISVVSPDGSTAGIVNVNYSQSATVHSEGSPVNIREGQSITVRSFTPSAGVGCEAAVRDETVGREQVGMTATANVSVRECGQPVGGARVVVVRETGGLAPTYPADDVGGGNYRATVPVAAAPGPPLADQCSKLIQAVNSACDAFEAAGGVELKLVVAASCALLRQPVLIAACEIAVAAGVGYCEFVAPFTDQLGDSACDAAGEAIDSVTAQQVNYSAIAYLPSGGQAQSGVVTAPAQGPIPQMSIEAADITGPALTAFTSPADPGPREGYDVTVAVSCRANADVVTVSVHGTDGYADSATCTLQNKAGGCHLFVPGGDTGVMDTITIVAGNETRTLFIVF